MPSKPTSATLLVLAVRDTELERSAEQWAHARAAHRFDAAVHLAGSKDAECIAALRACGVPIAQAHPLVSMRGAPSATSLAGSALVTTGDRTAVRHARRLARALGMEPISPAKLDHALYHAAAALVANGAAALAATGAELMAEAGVAPERADRMLAALLASVAANVGREGAKNALTGPVRRGDAQAVCQQLEVVGRADATARPLLEALVSAQLPLAHALGDAPAEGLRAIRRALDSAGKPSRRSRMRRARHKS